MRVAPVALFTAAQPESVCADTARDTALLTHSHPLGYNGAVLQVTYLDPSQSSHNQHHLTLPYLA